MFLEFFLIIARRGFNDIGRFLIFSASNKEINAEIPFITRRAVYMYIYVEGTFVCH
jgi:hypothetical protein